VTKLVDGDPVRIELQIAANIEGLPSAQSFSDWATCAARNSGRAFPANTLVTIRIVGETESASLNSTFRNVSRATNVLAFPAPAAIFRAGREEEVELGDLAICASVVLREAAEQAKQPLTHFAHMTVHGVLHLAGYDHGDSAEAREMESLEQKILAELGYPDPYRDQTDDSSLRQA
jgi:probable rRNA maturation factor